MYSSVVPGYLPRLIEPVVSELLSGLPAVALDGAKGVGKASTTARLARTRFDLDKLVTRELIINDPSVIKRAEKPVLLDEWQYLPEVWNHVRRAVDEDPSAGQFLLTGSALPSFGDAKLHSGAGRIVRLRMRPLSIQERRLEAPAVSLGRLLKGEVEVSAETAVGYHDYLSELALSGLPGIRRFSEALAAVQLDGYLENIVEREFPEQGLIVRKPHLLRAWMRAYAAATGTTASYTTILDAATAGESDKPARTTTSAWRDALASLWMLDPVEPWLPSGSPFKRLARTPKHYLADPALAIRLLDLSREQLERGSNLEPLGPQVGTITGHLFESLVALSLHTYAEVNRAQLRTFRSEGGEREIDFIVEKHNAVVAIEVKMAPTATSHDVRHLNWLRSQLGERLVAAVVITTGQHVYRRKDGVLVVPAALLGA